MPDSWLRQHIGEFIIEDALGEDASGAVFRAMQPSVNRQVVLKLLDLASPAAAEGFIRAAHPYATLEHIHILPVYDYGVTGETRVYIAGRQVRRTLADALHVTPLPTDLALDIFYQAVQALAYAHTHGLTHGGLTPHAIALDDLNNAFVTGFYIPGYPAPFTHLSMPPTDPAYAAYTAATAQARDLVGMCAIAYRMLTGELPPARGEIVPVRRHNRRFPREVDELIVRGLRGGIASGEELLDALGALLGVSASGTRSSTLYHVRPPAARPRAGVWLTLMLFIVIAAFAVWFVLRSLTPPASPSAAIIQVGMTGGLDDVLPDEGEIALARARVGDSFVAYVNCAMQSEFQVQSARLYQQALLTYGLDMQIYDSQLDRYEQLTQIEKARIDGARAIILCPLDSDLLTPTLESLRQSNVPVLLTVPYTGSVPLVRIDADNYAVGLKVGTYAGEFLRAKHGQAVRAIVLYYPNLKPSVERIDGMIAGVEASVPGLNIVGRYVASTRAEGYQMVSDALAQNLAFEAILCLNDAGAYGAVEALQAADVPVDAVDVFAVNGETQMQALIADGVYARATVRLNTEVAAQMAAGALIRLLAGGTLPETLSYPPGDLITRDNATLQ